VLYRPRRRSAEGPRSRRKCPIRTPPAALKSAFYWENILALVVTHLAGLAAIAYLSFVACSGWTLGLGLLWLSLCMLSTTGGYHRLFAHRTYRGAAPVRLFYLLFGAAGGQASVVNWASDHRSHHARTDTEEDPYNIRRGFWWAHVGWLLYRDAAPDRRNVNDLLADPLVRFQDRHYLSLLLGIGFLMPTLLASIWGDAIGGLLVAGFLRLLVQYHSTFSINSVAHTIGRRPYTTAVSARDSFITAILTLGEGYHNYHHRFPGDYRNGIRFYQFDPTKWWIWLLSKFGMTWGLKRVPPEEIRRARLAAGRPSP
jgi:stearoyl-CoA desaturase (delta-9 desaturase)